MIALASDCLLFETMDGESIPFSAEMISIELMGNSKHLLDADTRLFDAELGLAQAELSELTALVEIYRALGGGWQA